MLFLQHFGIKLDKQLKFDFLLLEIFGIHVCPCLQ